METKKVIAKQRIKNRTVMMIFLVVGIILTAVGLTLVYGIFGSDLWMSLLGLAALIGGVVLLILFERLNEALVKLKDMPKNAETLYLVLYVLFFIGAFMVGFFFAPGENQLIQLILGLVLLLGGLGGIIGIQAHLLYRKKHPAPEKPAKVKPVEEKKSSEDKKTVEDKKPAEAKKPEEKKTEVKKEVKKK